MTASEFETLRDELRAMRRDLDRLEGACVRSTTLRMERPNLWASSARCASHPKSRELRR
jgi:hypothetical protein